MNWWKNHISICGTISKKIYLFKKMTTMKIKNHMVQKKCAIKRNLTFEHYKSSLQASQIEYKIMHLKIITLQ